MLDEEVELEDGIGSAEAAAASKSSIFNLSRVFFVFRSFVDLVSVLMHCIRMPFIVFVSVSSVLSPSL